MNTEYILFVRAIKKIGDVKEVGEIWEEVNNCKNLTKRERNELEDLLEQKLFVHICTL